MPLLDRLYLAPGQFRAGTLNAYLLAAVIVALATALRVALGPVLPGVQFISLFPAIMVTTLISGAAAGAFAVLLSVVCAWYFILPPMFSFRLDSVEEFYALLFFVLVAAAIVGAIGAMRTAIERVQQLNNRLSAANQTLAAAFEASPDAILLTNRHGRIVNVNRRAVELFGKPRNTLIEAPLADLLPERFRHAHAAHYEAYLAAPGPRGMGVGLELFGLRQDGSEFPVDIQIGPIRTDGDILAIAIVRDLTEQRATAKALEDSRRKQAVLEERQRGAEEMRLWADAFQHAAIGIGIADPKSGRVLAVNPAFAAARGMTIEEAQRMPFIEQYAEAEHARLPALFAESEQIGHVAFESRHVRKDGSTFPVQIDIAAVYDTDGTVRYRVGSSRDITQSRRTEEMLRHVQKMEAIGTVAGGMAHDFNNLLAVIILNLDLMQPMMAESDAVKDLLDDAIAAARSGAELTRSLLAFARRQALQPIHIALNDLLANTHRLLSHVLGDDIELSLHPAPDLWPVIADRSQVEACIVNLATNARDAMPYGGRLSIATGNRRLTADCKTVGSLVAPGDYVMIEVADNGTGMSPELLGRVFEPFFTTKPVGHGTGLGLSMVLGFTAQSGGHVTAESEPNRGTTICVYLPRAHAVAEPPRAPPPTEPPMVWNGHGETVLVVEDNAALRRVVLGHLARLNYRAIECASASMAMTVLEAEPVDLVFTDIVMPGGVDGLTLAARVSAQWPSVRVLLTSGYSGARVGWGSDQPGASSRVLSKPYDFAQLARALHQALAPHGAPEK